jgi:hypothetical protein
MSNQWTFPKYDNLDEAVLRFIEILETKEISNNDVEFHPVRVSDGELVSCRVHKTAELNNLIPQMKELAYSTQQRRQMHEWNI